jgi:hypothetical protein
MGSKLGLHQKYMANYEYRMMLARYETESKDLGSYYESEEERLKRTKKKVKYDPELALKRRMKIIKGE